MAEEEKIEVPTTPVLPEVDEEEEKAVSISKETERVIWDNKGNRKRTDAWITKDYNAMQSIVTFINEIISDAKVGGDGRSKDEPLHGVMSDAEKKEVVFRNYSALEAKRSLTDWKGNEDWTDVDKAITDGKAYVG